MRVTKALFLCFLFFAVVVRCDKDDSDDDDKKAAATKHGGDKAEQRLLDCNKVGREIEWDVKKDHIKLKVDADKQDRKDYKGHKGLKCDNDLDVKIENSGNDGCKTEFSLRTQNGDAKTRFDFKMRLSEIVEFQDTGPTGWDVNDTVVQTWTIGGEDGDEWVESDEDTDKTVVPDPDNKGCYSFGIHTESKIFAAVGRYCNVPGVKFTKDSGREWVNKYNITRNLTLSYKLDPNVIKFDYLINKFPYQQDDTKLAIVGKLKTKSKFKVRHIGTVYNAKLEDEIDINGGEGGFSWATTAHADGEKVNVLMTKGSLTETGDDSEHKYVWTFDKVGKIDHFIWDPSVVGDFGGDGTSGVTALVPTLTAAVVALFVLFN